MSFTVLVGTDTQRADVVFRAGVLWGAPIISVAPVHHHGNQDETHHQRYY